MHVESFFHEPTATLTHVVADRTHGVAIVIDPVRDYDPKSGRVAWDFARTVAAWIDRAGLRVAYAVDTHAHADHLSGLPFFRERYGARTVTGARVGVVQAHFREVFNLGATFPVDGRQFDILLDEGERLTAGALALHAMHTPGHTPAHMSWRVEDAVFVGDTLFAPDYGTARCDFPGGDAGQLWDSVQRLYGLPDDTRLFLAHDYRPSERPVVPVTTVGAQKAGNVHLDARTSRDAFIALRTARDRTLEAPVLLLPSVQVNIRAGVLPPPEANGTSYLKIPLRGVERP